LTNRDAALEWARRGWAVFPCRADKTPATAHGFKDATRDAETITAHEWPMIGAVPGSAELVVLDVDAKAGTTLADIPADGLETRRHRTPSGGWHLIYKARPGAYYGNGRRPDIADGCDVRHQDGYVILPPSSGYRLEHDAEPLEAPTWLERSVAEVRSRDLPPNGEPIPRGEQDETLFGRALWLLEHGLTRAEAIGALWATAQTRCVDQDERDPWTTQAIARKIDSAANYVDPTLRALNSGELAQYSTENGTESPDRRLKLLTSDDLATLPPVEFLLPDVLVKGGFNVLTGPSGSGKSFMAIDWAARVAEAGGRVVYVMAEGAGGAYKRLLAWSAHHELKGRLPAIDWLVQSFDLMTETPEMLELAGPRDLFIFDTLHRVTPGIDEDKAIEMGKVIRAVDHVREHTGAATLLVHHSGWNESRERGSTALRGAADIMTHMRRHKDEPGLLELVCAKTKEAEHWQPRCYRLISVLAASAVIVPADPPNAGTPTGDEAAGAWIADLRRAYPDTPFKRSDAQLIFDLGKNATAERLKRLVDLGLVERRGSQMDASYMVADRPTSSSPLRGDGGGRLSE